MRNTTKTLRALLPVFALSACMLSSCLKEQEDFFDEPATLRLQNTLDRTAQILRSAEYGWAMDYYPDRNLNYGGYVYTVRFDSLKAEVRTELSPDSVVSSYYSMGSDDGAILTFDTYNKLMHFFATPSSSEYEAKDGDFEFVIDSISQDVIKLHGKRNQNHVYLHRLTEPAESYISKVIDMGENFVARGSGSIGSLQTDCQFDLNKRILQYTDEEGAEHAHYFVFTDQGLRFYEPFEVEGNRIEQLVIDSQLNMTAPENSAIQLKGEPHDSTFVPYSAYIGGFYFSYYNGQVNVPVILRPNRFQGGFDIVGLSSTFNVFISYDKNTGCLELNPQIVGIYANPDDGLRYGVYFMAWNSTAGNLTWTPEAGMKTVWNGDTENPVYEFVSNDYQRFQTDSYYIAYVYLGDDGYAHLGRLPSEWGIGGNTQVPYITSLIKRN